MRKIYFRLFTLALALMVFATDGFSQKSILFVGRYNYGDFQSDVDIMDSLTAWGYAPLWVKSVDFASSVVYDPFEAVVMGESVDSKDMARFGTTDGYPLPLVTLEGYCAATGSNRWEWIADIATELFQSSTGTEDDKVIVIKDNAHYITEDFNIGDEVPWSAATETSDIEAIGPVSIKEVNKTYSAKLAQVKSQLGQTGFWNLVTIDNIDLTGNRIVYWGVHDAGLSGSDANGNAGSYGTPEFFQILHRSVQWILNEDGGGTAVQPLSAKSFELVTFPNPASERVYVRFRNSYQGEVTVTLYNVAGQQVDRFHRMALEGINDLILDVGNYPAGIYQLHLDLDGKSSVAKVVIR